MNQSLKGDLDLHSFLSGLKTSREDEYDSQQGYIGTETGEQVEGWYHLNVKKQWNVLLRSIEEKIV